MRAIVITEWTRPEHLRVSEYPAPHCGPQEVLIDVHAAALSHSLSLLVQGRYQRKPAFPFIPGNTVAGVVSAVGEAVVRFQTGDRVLASLQFGALAELAVAHEDNTWNLPTGIDFAEGTTFNTAYNSVAAGLTWPHLLHLQQGQTLLVTGASGGVGTATIQVGTLLGARVIAAASTVQGRKRALEHGATAVVDSNVATLRDAVREQLPDMDGVDAALETVGGAVFDAAMRCAAPGGRILPIGFAGGTVPQIAANLLLVKNISVCGLYMGYYKIDQRTRYAPLMRQLFTTLGEWWCEGLIRPDVSARVPLERTPEGFALTLDRSHHGHVVVDLKI